MDPRGIHNGLDKLLGEESPRDTISKLQNELRWQKEANKRDVILSLIIGSGITLMICYALWA
jgi:hypothetical protein